MIRFDSYESYKDWIGKKESIPNRITNCFLMPDKIHRLIDAGKLFGYIISNGILLLEDAGTFYRCYYYLNPNAEAKPLLLDKTAVIELLYANDLTADQNAQLSILSDMSFIVGRKSSRMSLPADQLPDNIEIPGITELAKTTDYDACQELFNSNFNPYYAYLPEREEWDAAIEKQGVFCIRHDSEIIGVLYSEQVKHTAIIRLLCIDINHRRQGFASELINAFLHNYKNIVRFFLHWVDISNTEAIALYKRFGYNFDNRNAIELINTNNSQE